MNVLIKGSAYWMPARVFLLASAGYHLLLGVAGFLYNRSFPIGSDAAVTAESARVFGIFETNGWHSLAALILSRDPSVFWLASNNAGQAIHSFTAIGGLASGFATPRE